jgi:hypothetical protein
MCKTNPVQCQEPPSAFSISILLCSVLFSGKTGPSEGVFQWGNWPEGVFQWENWPEGVFQRENWPKGVFQWENWPERGGLSVGKLARGAGRSTSPRPRFSHPPPQR